ncbi:MAG: DNA gyrase subunit A [Candidatus Lightella neohaematopini]|nr:DNA gyrase subunit A [Candidatus Lightella neohaematopini]
MSNSNNKLIKISIEEELKNSYLNYAMSVIISRALPDARDGLKPVHRRILFAMYKLNNVYSKPYKKSARIVGDVIGKYHPHGDVAVYDTIVRMAQSFSLRYLLIDGQGNFGSVDGDSAAAMRYTEIRMTKIAGELLIDIEKDTVDFIYNYDNTEKIPYVMPTRIPNLLINGTSGIAVGMATNIPPHNISEVISGCLAYINNEDISNEELIKYIPGPDFPTAAIINGKQGIINAYCTGKGTIYIKAKTNIELDSKTNKENIVVYEIPYQVNKTRLIEKITELVKEKKIDGISNLRDESDKDGMRIVIEIKRDHNSQVVLNNLYSLTQLQISFGINMVALYQGRPKIMSLKDMISVFVDHRREIITRRINFDLQQAHNTIIFLEAMIVVVFNTNLIIDIIKTSNTSNDAINILLSKSWKCNFFIKYNISNNEYILTKKQAQYILDLRLNKLTKLEKTKLIDDYNKTLFLIKNLNSIKKDPKKLMLVIINELNEIKKQYNDKRKTVITENVVSMKTEDFINQENVLVTLSYYGYVKYQPLTDYSTNKRGSKGKLATIIKEKDFISCLLVANTHDTILLFSSLGRVYYMKVYQLPEFSNDSRGRPIVNLLPLELNERITTILPLKEYNYEYYVLMATANGIVKKTMLKEFSNLRSTGIIAINLNHGDELIGVSLTNGNNDIMLFSSYGKVVRFPEKQVRNVGRSTIGVKGINLSKHDRVVSLIVPNGNGAILTVTQNGYGKRTNQVEYPTKSRATKGVISIKVNSRNGKVIGAVQVNNEDQIVMITSNGKLSRTRVSEVSIISRNTQGVVLTRVRENETLVKLQRIENVILKN